MNANTTNILSFVRVFSKRLLLLLVVSGVGIYANGQNDSLVASSGTVAGGLVAQPVVGEDYVISPDDVLDVYVVEVVELSRAFRVSSNGTITLPYIPQPLKAAGLTLPQLSSSIREALHTSGVVTNALVTVSVQQSRLHSVSVSGSVKHPQIYPLFGRSTLLDVISQAEGLAPDAGNTAVIRRGEIAARALGVNPEDETGLTSQVDITKMMEVGDRSANVAIYPGDRVTVQRAGIVYVIGAVNKPGGYTIRPNRSGMTVMQAVALAENVKSTARRDQAMIIRVDAQSEDGRKQIRVNLKEVLAGRIPDPTLQTEDILFVPDSTALKAMQKGLESAVQITTGIIIYRRD